MAEYSREGSEVNARIVYWGPVGSGKSSNLEQIHAKLRSDHRGQLRRVPTRLDPTVTYEVLPIELGEVSGVRTRLQVVAVPGAPEHVPTRKQLLDRVDGVVFVIDAQRDRIEDNLASFAELRRSLAAYGRTIADVPLVLQYNKRDLADPYALEELHRKLDMRGAAAFEAIAADGTAVLPTLTTISKRVVRHLRSLAASHRQPQQPTQAATAPPPGVSQVIDRAAASTSGGAGPTPAATRAAASRPTTPASTGAQPPAPPGAAAAPTVPPARPASPSPPAAEASPVASASAPPAPAPAAPASPPATTAAAPGAATAATREALDAGFEQYRAAYERGNAPPLDLGRFEIAEIGDARIEGPRGVRLPLVLRDSEGHTLSLDLALRLDPPDDPEKDA